MSTINDGGRQNGISVRDRLAESAMKSLVSRTDTHVPDTSVMAERVAAASYRIADAMLAERAKVPA